MPLKKIEWITIMGRAKSASLGDKRGMNKNVPKILKRYSKLCQLNNLSKI
jgi:hypothetical protein